MITILDNSKTLPQLVVDKTNGKGVLFPIEATVEEDLNGVYELKFKFTVDEKRYKELSIGSIVRCNAGEREGIQLFRVVEISKERKGIISVYAQHISYDLNKLVVRPFTSVGAVNACNALISNTIDNTGFTIETNLTDTTKEFKTEIPYSFRACLGGIDNSIISLFGCELEWDNLKVKVVSRRGANTNVRVAYGKNLVDLQQDENIENTYNCCIGYAQYNEEQEKEGGEEGEKETVTKYCVGDMQYLETNTTPKALVVDFSKEFDKDNLPTVEAVNQLAINYMTQNAINVPKVSLKVSFVALWQTNEYKNLAPLEMVGLGDTLKVDFPKLNVSADARVIKRVWNVLTERYDTLELGDPKESLSTILSQTSTAITNVSKEADNNTLLAENAMLVAQSKQDKLTAGTNIQIVDNVISAISSEYSAGANIQINNGVISATDTTYSAGTGITITGANNSINAERNANNTYTKTETDNLLNNKQAKLTAGSNIQISNANVISATDTKYTAGTNVQISNANVISATDTKYTAGSNVQISSSNVISATDTKYTAGTGISISGTTINVKDDYVKLVGDTMSGELTIQKASGQTMFRTKRTDNAYDVGFGCGANGKVGMHDFKNSKWVLMVDTDNTVRMAGTVNITGNATSKPLRVRNIVGSDGTITDGNLYLNYGNSSGKILLGQTGAYNISADGKTYSGHLVYSTTELTNAPTANYTSYDNHGKIERYGAICFLDLNFLLKSPSSGSTGLGIIPNGYKPKLKHTINVSADNGIEGYVQIGTDGVVNYTGVGRPIGNVRALISYVANF